MQVHKKSKFFPSLPALNPNTSSSLYLTMYSYGSKTMLALENCEWEENKKFSLPPFVHFNVHTGKHFIVRSACRIKKRNFCKHTMLVGEWVRKSKQQNWRKSLLFYSLTHSLFSPTYMHPCLPWSSSKRIKNGWKKISTRKWQLPLPTLCITILCVARLHKTHNYDKLL